MMEIRGSQSLVRLPDDLCEHELWIRDCPNLAAIGARSTFGQLGIRGCPSLKTLPADLHITTMLDVDDVAFANDGSITLAMPLPYATMAAASGKTLVEIIEHPYLASMFPANARVTKIDVLSESEHVICIQTDSINKIVGP